MFLNKNKFAAALNRNKTAKMNDKGFSLVEASIVLGIVALVIGGIWVGAASVQENFRVGKAEQQILQIAQETKRFFYGSRNLNGLNNQFAINQGLVPEDMVVGSDALTNPWGEEVNVTAVNNTTNFEIEVTSLPGSACATIVSRLSMAGRDTGIRSIEAAGSTAWDEGDSVISAAAAATACGSDGEDEDASFKVTISAR